MALAVQDGQTLRLNALQQRRVWDGWFNSEVRAQYFAALAHRYQRLYMFVTWGTLMASSGALASILAHLGKPDPEKPFSLLAPFFALVATALSLSSVVGRFAYKSTDARDLYQAWSVLADRYRGLWENMYDENALNELAQMDSKAIELGQRAALFPNKPRLVRKCYNRVKETLAAATGAA
jgi:hypothetical protein